MSPNPTRQKGGDGQGQVLNTCPVRPPCLSRLSVRPVLGFVDEEKEHRWDREKQDCYARWRESKLAAAVAYLGKQSPGERRGVLELIAKKFSRDFATEAERRFGEAKNGPL